MRKSLRSNMRGCMQSVLKNSRFEKMECKGEKERLSLFGLLFPLYFVSTMFDYVGIIPGVSPARLMALLLVFAAVVKAKSLRLRIDGRVFALSMLLLAVILSVPVVDNLGGSFNPMLSFVLNILLVYIAASVGLNAREKGLAALSFIVGSFIVCGMVLLDPSGVNGTERSSVSVLGYTQDPNELCAYFIVPSLLLLRFSEKKTAAVKAFCFLAVALFFLAALSTGSRGGLLALLVALAVYSFVYFKRAGSPIWILILIPVALFVVVYGMDFILGLLPSSVSNRFLGVTFSDATVALRFQKWQEVLSSYMQSSLPQQLFGHGFGASMQATSAGLVAHNAYIEVLYSLGTFGFVALLCFFSLVFGKAVRDGKSVVYAALFGFFVLWVSLSAVSLKIIWALVMFSFLLEAPCLSKCDSALLEKDGSLLRGGGYARFVLFE